MVSAKLNEDLLRFWKVSKPVFALQVICDSLVLVKPACMLSA